MTGIRMQVGVGGFKDKTTQVFVLPMRIPKLDAEIENGELYYIGTDGKKKKLGPAKGFFNLDDFSKKDLYADNQVKDSNKVTVYLEKSRFLKVFKTFLQANGQPLLKD